MSSPTDGDARSTLRGHLEVGQRFEQAGAAEKALAAYRAALGCASEPADRAMVLLRLSRVHRTRAAWNDAIESSREAARLADALGDDDLAAEAMNAEVGTYALRGRFDDGHALAERALARARAPRIRGMLLQNRGVMAARARDFIAAERHFADSIAAYREACYERGLAGALNNAAAASLDAGDPARALDLAGEAADVAMKIQAFDYVVLALQNKGEALVGLDRLEEAESMLGRTLGHFASSGDVLRQAECLEILGGLHERRDGGEATAIRCLARAADLASSAGDRILSERVAGRLARLGAAPAGTAAPAASAAR
jgi:tetratricopeptide (TPR) repeat protein